MNILNWFRKPKLISGILPDIRPQEEKQKDFRTEEILVSATPLLWEDWNVWRQKPENIKMLSDIKVNCQNNVGSCASQAGSLALAINNYIEDKVFHKFSAKPIYARRKNKPNAGMYMADLAKICRDYGTIPEKLYPSPNDTEANMSNLDDYISAFEGMAKVLRVKNYFWLYETTNIDSFARVSSLGKPIVLTVIFGDGEFGTIAPEVKAVVPKYGHAITILPDSYFVYKGKKAVLIQNSWGDSRYYGGRQIITEEWFTKNRVVCGIFFEDLQNLAVLNPDVVKPQYNFTNDLYFGMRNDEVKVLQKCLATEQDSEGYLFPIYQTCTGYFGSITLQAVKRFQAKYEITPVAGYCGIKTRTKLNELFI